MKKNGFTLGLAVMLSVAFSSALLTGCTKNEDPDSKKTYQAYEIKRFADNPYLAEVWWGDDYDFESARQTLNNKYNQPKEAGGCSSWHKGNFHGRNIDWMMRDYATIIIHMPKGKDVKYASVSLLAGNPVGVKSLLDNNTTIPENYRNTLAASVIDGMNEKGVVINHNIVPYEGAAYEKNGYMTTVMLCRYILDNCADAEEARALLESKSITQALVGLAHDYSHFMVSDPSRTYVFEWINNKFVPTLFTSKENGNFVSEKGQNAIMTNYFVNMAEKYGLGTQEFFKNHLNGAGVERTRIIDEQLKSANTVDDHLKICKSVWYKQFSSGTTGWYTENAGYYGYDAASNKSYYWQGNEKVYLDTDDIYEAAKAYDKSEQMQKEYESYRSTTELNSTNLNWFTQHSVVYDLKNLKGYLIMQEGMFSDKVIEFGIE